MKLETEELKKYEFTGEENTYNGNTVRRIRAIRDFGNIKAGDLGGWLEKEENLSHRGNCWVADNATIRGDARILDDAVVSGNATVYGRAIIRDGARVYDEALIYGNTSIYRNAQVYGDATVYEGAEVNDNAKVFGEAKVYGNAQICGNAQIYGDASVYGLAKVFGNAKVHGFSSFGERILIGSDGNIEEYRDYMSISGLGRSWGMHITFYRNQDGGISVATDDSPEDNYSGTISEFRKKIKTIYYGQHSYEGTKYEKAYNTAADLAKIQLSEDAK